MGSSCRRDVIGDSAIIGDTRWAGTYGVKADFVATTHCSVAFVETEATQASSQCKIISSSKS